MANDLELLQGVWRIASLEIDGASLSSTALSGATISIAGDRFTTVSMGAEFGGRCEVNDPHNPKQLAMHFESGPEAGNSNYGIYELDGSTWKLCLNMTGGPAPGSFEAAPGSGCALETLIRGTAESPAAPVDESVLEPVPELQGEWAMVSSIRGGEAIPASYARHGKRTIDGIRSTLYFGSQVFMQGLLRIDEAGVNCLKLHHTAGELIGTTQLGIYELTGDTLKTCFGAAGQARPTEYGSSKASGETFTIWKRIS